MDFFELLRQLESPGRRFGRAAGDEPARLGQAIRLAFAASDVLGAAPAEGDRPPRIDVNVIGLFGPEGPMPLHLTRWMLERASNRWFAGAGANATSDTAFLDFGNMLQHRMIALYWRAWADARPEVQIGHGTGGAVAAMLRALAGTGLTDTAGAGPAEDGPKLRHATSLFQRVQGPDRLTEYIATVTGHPVRLVEFVGVWTAIPARLQTRLGRMATRLGRDAVVGARIFERQSRAEVRIGPLGLRDYLAFLDDPTRLAALRHALRFATGPGIDFDLRLVLDASEVPEPRFGNLRLGQVAWLGRPQGVAADDLTFRRVTRPPEPEDIAA